jgi:hypothetical protein
LKEEEGEWSRQIEEVQGLINNNNIEMNSLITDNQNDRIQVMKLEKMQFYILNKVMNSLIIFNRKKRRTSKREFKIICYKRQREISEFIAG